VQVEWFAGAAEARQIVERAADRYAERHPR
jgi:hypothetical protein